MKVQKNENEEEIDQTLHILSKTKLQPLLNYLWTDLEKVLVDMPCEFKTDTQKKYRNGFLVITYGAVYIFKNKLLGSPPPSFILTLLDCNTVTCDENTSMITMSFIDFDLEIKVKESTKIIFMMAKIVAECTYGLEQLLILPRFQIKRKSLNEMIERGKYKKVKNNKIKNQKESNSTASDNSASNSYSAKKTSKSKINDDNSSKSTSNSPSTKKRRKSERKENDSTTSDNSASNSSSTKKTNKNEQNENNSLNNSSSTNERKNDEQNEKDSTASDISDIECTKDKETNQNDDDPKTTNLKDNNLKTNLSSNITYSRSDSNFFYCGSDELYSAFDRIHLSTIVTTRPKHALVNRCLFLAHFYNAFGHHLGDGCQYMAYYDESPGTCLTFGPNFIPDKFSLSYGHAIGWETNLTKVVFYHFKPMYFGQLLESLLINSVTIDQVCFVDYKFSDNKLSELQHFINKDSRKRIKNLRKKSEENNINDDDIDDEYIFDEKHRNPKDYFDHFIYLNKNDESHQKLPIYIPDFSFNKVTSSKVTSFWFHDCDYPVIASFFNGIRNYVCPINEFEITSCNLTTTQIEKIFKYMTNFACFAELKTLAFLKNTVKMFSIDYFNQFINVMCNLESIDISECQMDGSKLFASLCKSHSPVKSVRLSNLEFNELKGMSTLTIPPTLIHADFTKSSFSPQSFKDILLIFTNKRTKKVMKNCDKITVELANSELSVMLCMANIKINEEAYEVFNTLDFQTLSDNICEFDWSQNKIPFNCINSFFKFLETQKKMRILILNNIQLEKQKYFFKRLLKYVMKQKLPGLDMRAKLYRKYGIPFYESLKEATFLRKLGVVIRNGSDEAMNKFTELIRVLPMLTECTADGFLPHTKESLINMWTNIINHPTICTTDLPRVDSLYLEKRHGIKIDDAKFLKMLKDVEAAGKAPSNMQRRTDFVLAQIRARKENIENNDSILSGKSDFFVDSCSTPWIDSTPHSRLENLQNSYIVQEQSEVVQSFDYTVNSTSPFDVTKEDGDEPSILLNVFNTNNGNETYDMHCIPDDLQSSGIVPSKMPEFNNNNSDENNKNGNENDEKNEEEENDNDDELDDQSLEIEESDSDSDNDD